MNAKRQSGFSLVPALFMLVVLAALAAVAVRLSGIQHQTVVLAMQSARGFGQRQLHQQYACADRSRPQRL